MEMKGKALTLWAKAVGAMIAVGGLALKATATPGLEIDDVLKVAGFVAIVFAPVDLSMVAGNVFNTRRGPRKGGER
jgi:hypothetical protein